MASAYIRLGIYEYNPADILGSGAFAIVYKGRFRDNKSQNVAIKQMIKGQNVLKSKTLLSKEISVLKAPEVLMCHKYDARADIWSMGIIVYQCFVGKAPFYANSPEALKNIYLKTIDLKPRRVYFTNLVPHKPASVPPLPSSVRRPRGSQSTGSRGTTSNRVYAAPALPSRRKTDVGGNRGRSTIAELMPTTARNLGRGSRIVQPTTVPRRESPATTAPPPPPLSPPLGLPSYSPPLLEGQEDFSDSSLTPTDDGNEYIEDGLGGSSFLVGGDRDIRQTPLSTEGLGTLDPCLADVLQRPRSLAANAQLPSQRVALDKSLEGYVIVESDGSGLILLGVDSHLQITVRCFHRPQIIGTRAPTQRASPSPESRRLNATNTVAAKKLERLPGNHLIPRTQAKLMSSTVDDPLYLMLVNSIVQRQTVRADYNGSLVPPELTEEKLMEPEHKLELQTVTMVLELCELLAELAERRASALTDCTTTTTTAVAQPADSNGENSDSSLPNTPLQTQQHTKLKLVPEAKRQQLVLYRRILYYLEYVFAQVKKAVSENRLKPTSIAKKRLTDCNALYHRCYIRLCQLSRLSRREDLLEPVGRHLSRVTANRLIFNYALDQCFAAEMDDYIGDLGLALRRYRAAITLIHGLCQHATTQYDKSLLSDCLRMIQDRHGTLWAHVAGSGCRARGDEIQRRISNVGLDSPLAPSSVTSEEHTMVATSCDHGFDFRLCGVTRALNDAPRTESQTAHEFSVSIAAPRNEPTGEQEDQDRDI
ncbi:unnamed protein product [Mesocestoides corti]|uniref:Protein kinase domain-containing protein n=2 Tax=Mesocestoides corti TaxID=53468 RepID=A0A0R3UM94_MESCO|nr:unnamed protein product [Mesocestoides corti]